MSVALELQGSIVKHLLADVTLRGLVDKRIYDEVPPNPTFPYIDFGEGQVLPDRADCYDGRDVIVNLHVWSRNEGFVETKRIGDAIERSLHLASLSVAGSRVVEIAFEQANYIKDPDGITRHGIITFRALTEPS